MLCLFRPQVQRGNEGKTRRLSAETDVAVRRIVRRYPVFQGENFVNATSENSRLAALVFGGALVAALFAWWMSLPPTPLPADAPAVDFSAYRAREHMKQLAPGVPHPAGSHENERNYDYIAGQLKAMGIDYTVETQVNYSGHGGTVVRDGAVLARIPGTASTGALAVDAHFDSTPYGPGATDDVSGCSAMLETIRALKAGPPLKNELLFCFIDKEEMGGGGPELCINHPWFKDVKCVLGLETRGDAGPALMFETGEQNGFMIEQLAKSGADVRATSIMFDFYGRMPFGTDFTRYKQQGYPGLNVAYIDNFCNYHTMLDSWENASLASLQHHGDYTLALCRQLGSVSLEDCKGPNQTYFNTIGSHLVVYPMAWGWPITLAVLAFFVVALLLGFLRGRLSVLGMLAAVAVYLSATTLSIVLGMPLAYFVYAQLREHALYRNNMFSIAFVLIMLGIFALVSRLARGRVGAASIYAGALLLWALPLVPAQIYLPGGVFALTWPLALGTAGLLALVFAKDSNAPAPATLAFTSLAALPSLIVLAPSFVMFSYTLTALAMPMFSVLMLPLVALYLPQTFLMPRARHTQASLALLSAGLVFFAIAFLSDTPSETRRHMNCLAYGVNFDTNEASWLSDEQELDEWTRNFFKDDGPRVTLPEFLGGDKYEYRRAPAPAPNFGKFVMEKREDTIVDGKRHLKFFIDSPSDAQELSIQLAGAEVYRSTLLGHEMNMRGNDWNVRLFMLPFEGGELELETEPGKDLLFAVHEVAFKLPDNLPNFQPRPDWMMSQTNRRLDHLTEPGKSLKSNHTYSICTYRF